MFAFARVAPVRSTNYLTAMSRHARRLDKSCQIRPDAVAGTALIWRAPGGLPTDDARDYHFGLRAHLRMHDGRLRKGAALAMHLLIGVSPAWVEEAGSLHAADNPRNLALFSEAIAWVGSWTGSSSVFGARLDLDEAGGSVVDVFCAPLVEQRHKSGLVQLRVSIRDSLKSLQIAHGSSRSYSALQTSWHSWAQSKLDGRLQRGESASITGRKHLVVSAFKKRMDALAEEGQLTDDFSGDFRL